MQHQSEKFFSDLKQARARKNLPISYTTFQRLQRRRQVAEKRLNDAFKALPNKKSA